MKKILLISMFLIVSLQIFAQSVKLEGVVSSADDGQTLPGVTILEKGTNNGTVTDIDGYYKITVSPEATLQFSYVGMESQEVQILGRSKIDIALI